MGLRWVCNASLVIVWASDGLCAEELRSGCMTYAATIGGLVHGCPERACVCLDQIDLDAPYATDIVRVAVEVPITFPYEYGRGRSGVGRWCNNKRRTTTHACAWQGVLMHRDEIIGSVAAASRL